MTRKRPEKPQLKPFTYEVNGNLYIQNKLVLGQVAQLIEFMQEADLLALFAGTPDAAAIADLLRDKLPRAIAIILTPEGESLKEKDLDLLTDIVATGFDLETCVRVIDDFFACNPVAFLLQRYTGIMRSLRTSIGAAGSPTSASSSPEETSPDGTPSSGASPQPIASPT